MAFCEQNILNDIIKCALSGKPPARDDLQYLLNLTDKQDIDLLFGAARTMRRRFFGNRVFLYGFVLFSTYCRNDCIFCHYRTSNRELARYRKDLGEIVEAARYLAESGVHLIDLTMGEDPAFYRNGDQGFTELTAAVKAIKKETGLPVMVSPGAVPDHVLEILAKAGADWLACYQETHSRSLFEWLRPRRDYDKRLRTKQRAKALGMLIEEGILAGVGDSIEDAADSMVEMAKLEADQVRVMTFVPQEGTPLAHLPAPGSERELLTIAALRLAFPDRLIPASLDVEGLAGLGPRLMAGANVVTSLVPPGDAWAGVAHCRLDIDEQRRTVRATLPVLESCGLKAADSQDYRKWMDERRKVSQMSSTGNRLYSAISRECETPGITTG